MPNSYHVYDQQIADLFSRAVPAAAKIVDVGAGSGKFGKMLKAWSVSAIEAHGPYIEQFNLKDIYKSVHEVDVRKINLHHYDVVILGDVLEHLSVADAQALLEKCKHAHVLVTVPFNYEQGAVNGVESEVHLQPDLTHEVFNERFPGFRCLGKLPYYGVYARAPKGQTLSEDWRFSQPETNVLIATPCHDWTYSTHYTVSMLATQRHHLSRGIPFSGPLSQSGAEVERARCMMLAQFMADPKYTHICFIDSDQGWPGDAVERLANRGVDVVGVPIRKKTKEVQWNFYVADPADVEIKDGLMEVTGIGTGMLMISRACVERMFAAYPELMVRRDERLPHNLRGSLYALFQRTIEDGEYVSEDLMFCRRWRAIGGKVYADPGIEVCHAGRAEYTGRLADFFQAPVMETV